MKALRAFVYCNLFESYHLHNRELRFVRKYLHPWDMPLDPEEYNYYVKTVF